MILQALFPRDIFAALERLQRDVQQNFDVYPNIRGRARGNFPALNVGGAGSRSISTRLRRDSTPPTSRCRSRMAC
jgi:hypothetical protein